MWLFWWWMWVGQRRKPGTGPVVIHVDFRSRRRISREPNSGS